MKMGERIRELRIKKNMSMDDLGKLIGTQRQAIMKYEKGIVENIPRKTIEKLARIFGVTPAYLMCFEEYNEIKEDVSVKVNELVQGVYGIETLKLIDSFTRLNEEGKIKVLSYIKDLNEVEKYKAKEKSVNNLDVEENIKVNFDKY